MLVLADSEEFKSTVVMLKIMDTKLAQAIRDSEHRVADKIDKLLEALGLGAAGVGVDGAGQEGLGEEDGRGGGGGMDSGQEGREGNGGKIAGGLEVQVLKMKCKTLAIIRQEKTILGEHTTTSCSPKPFAPTPTSCASAATTTMFA